MDVFSDSQHRIESMSLIHEELYKSADHARVDFGEYMSSLTENLFESYGVVADQVTLGIDVDAPPLDIDKAIPLGLIVNELVSNSLKYAFPESEKGTITISLNRSESGGFVLIVGDDGVGIQGEIDFGNVQTLGLRLVDTLAGQLKGTVELNRLGEPSSSSDTDDCSERGLRSQQVGGQDEKIDGQGQKDAERQPHGPIRICLCFHAQSPCNDSLNGYTE